MSETQVIINCLYDDKDRLELVYRLLQIEEPTLSDFQVYVKSKDLTKAQALKLVTYSSDVVDVSKDERFLYCELFGGGNLKEMPFAKLLAKLGSSNILVDVDWGGGEDLRKYALVDGKLGKVTVIT